MKKSWSHKTKRGVLMFVEQLPSGVWLGQQTGRELVKTGHGPHLTMTDFVLDHFETVEAALEAVGWPVDIAGVPDCLLDK